MIQKDLLLLLQDLCARLPYGVKLKIREWKTPVELTIIKHSVLSGNYIINENYKLDDIKLYLRPMSSMTEEECDMVEEILGDKCIFDFMSNGDVVLKQGRFSQNKLAKLYDYYNFIHIDYRGLIPKGLALEAPEGMYDL